MPFNATKCKVIHVGHRNLQFDYQPGGVSLGETEVEKDLGVLMHQSLKPTKQCKKAA